MTTSNKRQKICFTYYKAPIILLHSTYLHLVHSSSMPMPKLQTSFAVPSNLLHNLPLLRQLLSLFMASTKMSCTQRQSDSSNSVVGSRTTSGTSKSLGEMELCQLESSGMSRCMEEFLKRSDLCCVSACCKCTSASCASAMNRLSPSSDSSTYCCLCHLSKQ
jgi:hypothetical protein